MSTHFSVFILSFYIEFLNRSAAEGHIALIVDTDPRRQSAHIVQHLRLLAALKLPRAAVFLYTWDKPEVFHPFLLYPDLDETGVLCL